MSLLEECWYGSSWMLMRRFSMSKNSVHFVTWEKFYRLAKLTPNTRSKRISISTADNSVNLSQREESRTLCTVLLMKYALCPRIWQIIFRQKWFIIFGDPGRLFSEYLANNGMGPRGRGRYFRIFFFSILFYFFSSKPDSQYQLSFFKSKNIGRFEGCWLGPESPKRFWLCCLWSHLKVTQSSFGRKVFYF